MTAPHISKQTIIDFVLQRYPGTTLDQNWGEQGIFYNPDRQLPKGIYLLTFKERDGANDNASRLREGSDYRLNMGIGQTLFTEYFGAIPERPKAGATVATGHDFSQHDQVMPHPVYGWMSWIAVINPSRSTLDELLPLLDAAVNAASKKFEQKLQQLQRKARKEAVKPHDQGTTKTRQKTTNE